LDELTINTDNSKSYLMKQLTIFYLFAFLLVTEASAQSKEVKFLIDTTIALMKNNSVNRNKVDWKTIEANVYPQITAKENAYQLGPVYRYLFKSVNDFHGAFYCWDSTYKWQRDESKSSDSIMNEWKKGVFIQTQILDKNIGYLRVPYISFDADRSKLDKKSQSLNDSLCSLLDENVKGIVLDLRLNGGGAMYPMMLGLEQLLQYGKVGSFENKDHQSWILKDDGFYLDTMLLTAITPKCKVLNKDLPVAILIGNGTGSSGEFLAISFKNRKKTVFIGTETAGYITTTRGFKINDAVTLLIAVGYGKDRTGQIYENALQPDMHSSDPDSFNDIKKDGKVLAAAKWINSISIK
jgi:carboxyl-terminal processing protease